MLVLLKIMHCGYKMLPNSFYKFYDHVTFDLASGESANSINSEGSDTDKDNMEELS